MTHPSTPPPPPRPGKGLTAHQRLDNYRKQNGSNKVTARQRRRIAKKAYRLLGHA